MTNPDKSFQFPNPPQITSNSSISINCCRPVLSNPKRTLLPSASPLKLRHSTESKRLGTFDIFFRASDDIELGDVARGWIELNLERAALLTSMCISFYGEIEMEIFGESRKKKFEMRKYQLWKYEREDNVNVMESGFYVYEFFIGTHTQLPVPFRGDGAIQSIVYFCEVTAIEDIRLDDDQSGSIPINHIKRKILNIKMNSPGSAPDSMPMPLQISESITEKGMMYVRNLVDCSGTIVTTVTLLDGRHYRPGENVRFNIEILNCFRKLKITAGIVQKAKACVDDCLVNVELDLVRVCIGKLATGETYKRYSNLAIWIPDQNVAPVHVGLLYANKLVQIGYAFRATVTTWACKKLIVEIPLIVRQCQTGMITNQNNYATL